jgi:hypothetical protein
VRLTGDYQSGYALGMLGVGDAFEEAVGGFEDGEGHFGAGDEVREFFAMAFAGFAEEDGFDLAAGFQGFLDQAEAFDADAAGVGLQAAAEGDAKLF